MWTSFVTFFFLLKYWRRISGRLFFYQSRHSKVSVFLFLIRLLINNVRAAAHVNTERFHILKKIYLKNGFIHIFKRLLPVLTFEMTQMKNHHHCFCRLIHSFTVFGMKAWITADRAAVAKLSVWKCKLTGWKWCDTRRRRSSNTRRLTVYTFDLWSRLRPRFGSGSVCLQSPAPGELFPEPGRRAFRVCRGQRSQSALFEEPQSGGGDGGNVRSLCRCSSPLTRPLGRTASWNVSHSTVRVGFLAL